MCKNSWSLLNAKENLRIKGEGEKRAWEGSPTLGRILGGQWIGLKATARGFLQIISPHRQ